MLLAFLLGATGSPETQRFLSGGVILGLFAIFGYGILGWIFTAFARLIYNGVAAWIGGIEVKVEAVAPSAPPPVWMAPTAPQPPPSG